MGHSKVKLTWDQTDAKREAKLQNGFKIQFKDSDEETEYYKDMLQQSSDSSGGEDDNLELQRQKLLSGLSGGVRPEIANAENLEDVDWDAINSDELNSEDLDALEKKAGNPIQKKSNLDIKFSKGFGEDVGKKLIDTKKEKKQKSKLTPFEAF